MGGSSPPEASVYSVKSVGGSSTPEASVYSVNSVGDYSPPEASVNSVNSVGGLAQTNLEWVLWKEFGGRRGYGRDAIPSYENSHGLHGYAQIRRVWHPAIPTPPSQGVHLSQVHQPSKPRISSHRIRRTHRNDWQRISSHGFHRCPQMVRLRRVLPRNSQNSQKLLA